MNLSQAHFIVHTYMQTHQNAWTLTVCLFVFIPFDLLFFFGIAQNCLYSHGFYHTKLSQKWRVFLDAKKFDLGRQIALRFRVSRSSERAIERVNIKWYEKTWNQMCMCVCVREIMRSAKEILIPSWRTLDVLLCYLKSYIYGFFSSVFELFLLLWVYFCYH